MRLLCLRIMVRYPFNVHPLQRTLVKLEFARVNIISLNFALEHRLCVLIRGDSLRRIRRLSCVPHIFF